MPLIGSAERRAGVLLRARLGRTSVGNHLKRIFLFVGSQKPTRGILGRIWHPRVFRPRAGTMRFSDPARMSLPTTGRRLVLDLPDPSSVLRLLAVLRALPLPRRRAAVPMDHAVPGGCGAPVRRALLLLRAELPVHRAPVPALQAAPRLSCRAGGKPALRVEGAPGRAPGCESRIYHLLHVRA